MEFEYQVEITPEDICDLYKIDIRDFLELVEGKKVIRDEKTILFVIEEYIKTIELNTSKSQLTIKYYITILRRFGRFILSKEAKYKMAEITEELFIEFTNSCKPLKGDKLSGRTYNTYRAIIRNLMEYALTRKYISEDLRNKIDKMNGEILPRYLPDELVPSLLKESKRTSWPFLNFAMIYFMLGTGCRVSEVASMRICDFQINENLIFIRKGKGQKERYIPMYPQIKKVIMDYLARSGVSEWDISDQSYLFSKRCYESREPIMIRNIQHMITGIYKKLNIDGLFTVHSLRHTFAYNALTAGMAIYDLQEILGHNSIETTRIYTKRRPADLRNAVQRYPFPLEKLVEQVMGIGEKLDD
ncbi:tyrosine-type recombinase/integrase [Paenibacillus sp. KN14-4R]|uniref:tyrosine-type recombinase/integrase n=1 Tax=Paenibacillus sp. KN14-4R TaxID=3445773 RepID=UPI003FA019FC